MTYISLPCKDGMHDACRGALKVCPCCEEKCKCVCHGGEK